VYYTFARTLPPSSKVSKSVVALLLYFKWTKFIIVAGKRPAWGREVQEAMKVRFLKIFFFGRRMH
jgi:guanylate cyclase